MSQSLAAHCGIDASPLAAEQNAGARRKLILVGNPNVGKSLLFGALTNRYVTVSNYPGTTVEITRARATVAGMPREVIDTPGANSLIPQSEDERVTRDILIESPDADVLQVGDMKNLRRTLLLTVQLAEYGVPFTLALNMSDEARECSIEVNSAALAAAIGVSVVSTSALRRWNLDKLQRAAIEPARARQLVEYSSPIEAGIRLVEEKLRRASPGVLPHATRGISVAILAGDDTLRSWLERRLDSSVMQELDSIRASIQQRVAEPLAYAIGRERLAGADRLVEQVFRQHHQRSGGASEWIGMISMHPVWGVPFLAAVLYIAYLFVGKLGAGTLVDFVEHTVFTAWINPWVIRFFDLITPFPHQHQIAGGVLIPAYAAGAHLSSLQLAGKFVHDLFVGPYGIVTMALTYAIAIVLPVVTTFFIFFGLMEDSGYLPRLAVMLDRVFKRMGLNGKAVLPMILGLGCDTMATLTTRILETRKEAIIVTMLLALGVPCSAQLGVIMAMLGPLAPAATAIWLGVIMATLFLVGWLASKLVRGDPGDFILEIPPIRIPRVTNILIKVAARTEWYLKEAVPLFIVGTLLLYLLDAFGALVHIQRMFAPLVVGALGLPAEASNAFLIGFLRRDYGAAGLFAMQRAGHLSPVQTVVSLTVITLFIPCVANFLVMIKERGMRAGLAIAGFIIVYSFGVGWVMNTVLHRVGMSLG